MNPHGTVQEIRFKIDRLSYNLCWPVRMERNELYLDHLANMAFLRLTRELPYMGSGPVVETPLNWKEAVKERWSPAWLKRRYPVRYKRWEAKHYFPNLPPSDRFRDNFSVFVLENPPLEVLE